MSNFLIAIIASLGASAWLYNKFSRRSGGGNAQPAIIGAIVSGILLFVVLYITLSKFF